MPLALSTILSLLFALVGLVLYFVAPNHRQLALVIFGCGLLTALMAYGGHAVRIGR